MAVTFIRCSNGLSSTIILLQDGSGVIHSFLEVNTFFIDLRNRCFESLQVIHAELTFVFFRPSYSYISFHGVGAHVIDADNFVATMVVISRGTLKFLF